MSDALSQLEKTVARLSALTQSENQYSGIGKARWRPNEKASLASKVRITSNDNYGSRASTEEMAAAEAIQKEFVARYRAEGEAEMRRMLSGIATEIDHLRAELPSLAAKACVQLAAMARDCRDEATT